MAVDLKTAPKLEAAGKTYTFEGADNDPNPASQLAAAGKTHAIDNGLFGLGSRYGVSKHMVVAHDNLTCCGSPW
jgi:hypothetical protein